MSTPEEIAAKLELLKKGLLNSEKIGQLRKSLKLDDDGNLKHVSQDGKFNIVIGKVAGGEVLIGDKFVIGSEALQDFISPPEINWQEASRTILKQKTERLTTNPMTSGEGIFHKTEQVYIPLGLVERKKQSQKENDVSPEQGSSLYEETGITRKFEHREFISRVLVEGDSPKSKGRRISIIGEPGAGKTTSLQQISNWIANNVDDAIVIWLPLADLQGRSVENYLFEHWLRSVARISGYGEVSRLIKDEFASLFQQDNIWLMLDGVDEVSGLSRNPLNELDSQLTGTLLSQAKVLLTCRLNLWDGNRHSLDDFDIYRTLEFSYPVQVESFIRSCFASREKSAISESLCVALSSPEAKRIQDLVKNPLRLTLLCFNWSLRRGKLPQTQAELYAQYVENIYDWKREQFPISEAQRQLLDAALSMLSCRAIDGADGHQNSRFRLREALVKEHLNKPLPGTDGSILDLALKIGWINQVGLDATDPTQKVYAFYHTTFEEYFAAIGIEQGNFFFSHSRWNINSKKSSYRLLEPYWKQVFILWCGRANVDIVEKDKLIDSLIHFKDGCRGFYSDRAFFIACDGINEFDSSHAEKIVRRLMKWRESSLLDYLLHGEGKAHIRTKNTTEAIKKLRTRQYNTNFVIQPLVKIVQSNRMIWDRQLPAVLLEAVNPGNELAIKTLHELINGKIGTFQDRRSAVENLGELSRPNTEVIRVLCKALEDKRLGATATKSLEQITENSESGIELDWIILEVSRSLQSLRDLKFATAPSDINGFFESLSSSPRRVIELLEKIGIGNPTALQALGKLLNYKIENANYLGDLPSIKRIVQSIRKISKNADSNTVVRKALAILDTQNVKIDKDTPFLEFPIKQNFKFEKEEREANSDIVAQTLVRNRAVSLFEFNQSYELVSQEMLRIIKSTSEQLIKKEAIQILITTVEWHTPSVYELMEALLIFNDEEIFPSAVETLHKVGVDEKSLVELLSGLAVEEPPQSHTLLAIDFLGNMETETRKIAELLASLINNSKNEFIVIHAANSLMKIQERNDLALQKLKFLSEAAVDRYARIASSRILGELEQETEFAIKNLIQIMEECDTTTEKDEPICNHAYHALSEIGINSVVATTELCRLLNKGMGRLHNIVAACLCKICDYSNNKEIKFRLLKEIEDSRDLRNIVAFATSFKLIEENNERIVREFSRILGESPRNIFLSGSKDHGYLSLALEESLTEDASTISLTIKELRRFRRQSEACRLLIRCSEGTSYRDFLRDFRKGRWIQIVHVFRYKTWISTFSRMREWCVALST